MRSGCTAAGAICLLLFYCSPACWGMPRVVINDRVVESAHSPQERNGEAFVSVLDVLPLLGVEVVEDAASLSLRWQEGWQDVPWGRWEAVDGVLYAPLSELVAIVGGTLEERDGEFRVSVVESRLLDIRADERGLVLRFDRFTPSSRRDGAASSTLTFFGGHSEVAPGTLAFGPAGIGRATLTPPWGAVMTLVVSLQEEGAFEVRRSLSDSAYVISVAVGLWSIDIWATNIAPRIVLEEWQSQRDDRTMRVAAVRVEAWRSGHELSPFASCETTSVRPSDSIHRVATLSWPCPDELGLLICHGVPYALGPNDGLGIGFDALRQMVTFTSEPFVFVEVPAGRIEIDAVGRPIGDREIVAYPPGYSGTIARGFPEAFRVVRIRDEAVVSVFDAPFVVAEPSATLIVATGAARERLSSLLVGSPARLGVLPGDATLWIEQAASAEAILIQAGVLAPPGTATGAIPAMAWSVPAAWSILGVDWHGSLLLLSVPERGAMSLTEVSLWLRALPVPLRDAVVVAWNRASALQVWVGEVSHCVGDVGAFAAGWSLVASSR